MPCRRQSRRLATPLSHLPSWRLPLAPRAVQCSAAVRCGVYTDIDTDTDCLLLTCAKHVICVTRLAACLRFSNRQSRVNDEKSARTHARTHAAGSSVLLPATGSLGVLHRDSETLRGRPSGCLSLFPSSLAGPAEFPDRRACLPAWRLSDRRIDFGRTHAERRQGQGGQRGKYYCIWEGWGNRLDWTGTG